MSIGQLSSFKQAGLDPVGPDGLSIPINREAEPGQVFDKDAQVLVGLDQEGDRGLLSSGPSSVSSIEGT